MARIVALGDAHLGRSHLAHLRDDQGRNVREEDFLRSFTWAVEETIRLEPDGFVWLGDVFDHARPTYMGRNGSPEITIAFPFSKVEVARGDESLRASVLAAFEAIDSLAEQIALLARAESKRERLEIAGAIDVLRAQVAQVVTEIGMTGD